MASTTKVYGRRRAMRTRLFMDEAPPPKRCGALVAHEQLRVTHAGSRRELARSPEEAESHIDFGFLSTVQLSVVDST